MDDTVEDSCEYCGKLILYEATDAIELCPHCDRVFHHDHWLDALKEHDNHCPNCLKFIEEDEHHEDKYFPKLGKT